MVVIIAIEKKRQTSSENYECISEYIFLLKEDFEENGDIIYM